MDLKHFLAVCLLLCLSYHDIRVQGSDDTPGTWDRKKYLEEAMQTVNFIFIKYHTSVRPPFPVVEMNMNLVLRHIRHLDLKKQELQTVMDVQVNWTDVRLQWYSQRIHNILVNASNIWLPDIGYTNMVTPAVNLYPEKVTVSSQGEIQWTKRELITTYCQTNLSSSQQFCSIELGFLSKMSDRAFTNTSTFMLPGDFVNHYWHVKEASMDLGQVGNDTDASTMTIDLVLEKKHAAAGTQSSGSDEMNMSSQAAVFDQNCCNTNTGSRNAISIISHILSTIAVVIATTALTSLKFLR